MSSSPFIDKLNKFYSTSTISQPKEAMSSSSAMSPKSTATLEDDRGFQKTENYVMINPNEANFQDTGRARQWAS